MLKQAGENIRAVHLDHGSLMVSFIFLLAVLQKMVKTYFALLRVSSFPCDVGSMLASTLRARLNKVCSPEWSYSVCSSSPGTTPFYPALTLPRYLYDGITLTLFFN